MHALFNDTSPLAWVMGATDPTSGTVSTYEVVRGLGVLLRKGWRPLRTIVLASWDAEEVIFCISLLFYGLTFVVAVWPHW